MPANRKYYYRRREGGSWTPWEQINLDIEDNPVIPVVWKGRLFLFWLRIFEEPPLDPPPAPEPGQKLKDVDASKVIKSGLPEMGVQAILCWSEYYNGKWQPTKTSDPNESLRIDLTHATSNELNSFRSKSKLSAVLGKTGGLLIMITHPALLQLPPYFNLYNTHSVPIPILQEDMDEYVKHIPPLNLWIRTRSFSNDVSLFYITYYDPFKKEDEVMQRDVLDGAAHFQAVYPMHGVADVFRAPFFFQDPHHVFYVTTKEDVVMLPQQNGFALKPQHLQLDMPPLLFEAEEAIPDRIGPVVQNRNFGIKERVAPERFVSEDAYISKAIATTGIVHYGEVAIGISGGLNETQNL